MNNYWSIHVYTHIPLEFFTDVGLPGWFSTFQPRLFGTEKKWKSRSSGWNPRVASVVVKIALNVMISVASNPLVTRQLEKVEVLVCPI